MPFDQTEFNENEVFNSHFLRDPFNEESFLYQHSDKAYFNVEAPKSGHKPDYHQTVIEPSRQEDIDSKNQKRSIKDVLKDASRQIIASIVILIIGFLLLNWSAYSKIIKNKWEDFLGIERQSPLTEIAEITKPITPTEMLSVSGNPDIQKKQIPALNLEVAPSDNRIIIPRIDQNIPIVRVSSESLIKRDWSALENDIQEALKNGVVHYPGTSLPGQTGNVVITGHSSYFPWDPGRFKDVFALLHEVVEGDRIVVYYEQDKYVYEVSDIKVVLPKDIEVLKQTPQDQLTLITCTPVGTNLKRLIVTAKPIAKNGIVLTEETLAADDGDSAKILR